MLSSHKISKCEDYHLSQNTYQNEKEINKTLRKSIFCLQQPKVRNKNNRPESLNMSFLIPFISFQKKLSSLRRFGERGRTV